jgi:hypothetical protein
MPFSFINKISYFLSGPGPDTGPGPWDRGPTRLKSDGPVQSGPKYSETGPVRSQAFVRSHRSGPRSQPGPVNALVTHVCNARRHQIPQHQHEAQHGRHHSTGCRRRNPRTPEDSLARICDRQNLPSYILLHIWWRTKAGELQELDSRREGQAY